MLLSDFFHWNLQELKAFQDKKALEGCESLNFVFLCQEPLK